MNNDTKYIVINKETKEAFDVTEMNERMVEDKKFLDVDFQTGDQVGGIAFELTEDGMWVNERYILKEKIA